MREFLAHNDIGIKNEESTREKRYDDVDALRLLKDISHFYAARGKKVIYFDLRKDKPGRDELIRVLLGPSGYLRAPTARKGKSLMVGFDETVYTDLFL